MELSPLGDGAVMIEWPGQPNPAALAKVRTATAALEAEPIPGVTDVVPAYTSVTVFYDLTQCDGYEALCGEITRRLKSPKSLPAAKARVVTIPVCYGGKLGPDLTAVAQHAGLSEAQVVQLHHAATYTVCAVGFTPGFPYLSGLPVKLHTPRRDTPRTTVPAGSVAIGGAQAGIYPLASPGGWNLIGRTPLPLFTPDADEPVRLRVGDKVKFKPVTPEEFAAWR